MNTVLYILDGKTPIPCFDSAKWDLSKLNGIVGKDQFGGEHDQYQERYCTWDEAEKGHQIACELVNKIAIDRDNKLNGLGI